MQMYERSLLIDLLETKILQFYPEYSPQEQYNNTFITYLYKYLKDNLYSGKHLDFYNELSNSIKKISSNILVDEYTDKQTFVIKGVDDFPDSIFTTVDFILKKYPNHEYLLKSKNKIIIKINFGWLPQNTGSWLDLLNSEVLIDYHIVDSLTLVPNTHNEYGKPDSGYVCYRIDNLETLDTVLFLIDSKITDIGDITFASLLEDLEGTKSAVLNRILKVEPKNCLYEVGPYAQSYLSASKSSLIIQVPYEYATDNNFYLFNVSSMVLINPENDKNDPNNPINWYVALEDKDYQSKFVYNYLNMNAINSIVEDKNIDSLDRNLMQYIFGDFIWKTSDSKLIAYAQNLIKHLYPDEAINIVINGIWTKDFSELVAKFKKENNLRTLFDDDVIDKFTEEMMLFKYKAMYNENPNLLFNEW